MKKNNKGFTLVELIVVLVILAILAAILVPTLLGYIDKARSEKDYSTAQTVRVAAQSVIDQAYADGRKVEAATPAVHSIENMDGTFTGTKDSTDDYTKLVYNLSGVDKTKVTAFKFIYQDGIITKGYVQINGVYYVIENNKWSNNAETEPTLS